MKTIRPSTLPQLAESPCYVPGPAGEDADRGTVRHELFRRVLDGDETAADGDPDAEAIKWAVEQVRLLAPMADYPLELEVPFEFSGPDFNPIPGRLDVQCGPVVLDLKWRWFDYTAQMAAYAMRVFDAGHPVATVHLLFAESRRVETLRFTRDEAESVIFPIIERAKSAGDARTPGSYCGWCVNCKDCPALLARANAVVAGRSDWELANYHPSEITDPVEMGRGLTLARQLKKWAETFEHWAKEMAVKQGKVPHGFRVANEKGDRYITSSEAAFSRAGIPQANYMRACEVSLTKLALEYGEFHGIKHPDGKVIKAAAERDIEAKLGELVQRKPASVSLVKERKK